MELPPSAVGLPPWCPALPGPVSNVIPIPRAAAANGMQLSTACILPLKGCVCTFSRTWHGEKHSAGGGRRWGWGVGRGPQPNSAVNSNSEQNTQPVCLGFLVAEYGKQLG